MSEQPQPIPAYTKINPIDHPVGTRIVYGKYHWHLLQEAQVVEWSSDGELVAINRAVSEVPEWKHVTNREMRVWAVVGQEDFNQ